jgi:PAS domain S-box-containing protein
LPAILGHIDLAAPVFEQVGRDFAVGSIKRQSQELLAAMIAGCADAIITIDLHGTVTSCNRAAADLFGFSAVEMLASNICILLPPAAMAGHNAILSSILLGNAVIALQTERLRKDGSPVSVLINSQPLIDEHGEFTGSLAMVFDVTARRQAESALLQSQERFRLLTESLPQLIWTCDETGASDFLSAQWTHYTGQPNASLLQYGWVETVSTMCSPRSRVIRSSRLRICRRPTRHAPAAEPRNPADQ